MIDEIQLRDGTAAMVWPLLKSDRAKLVEEFEKLSTESRHQRFLSPVAHLSESMLRHLVDDVDGVDHVALVLVAEVEDGVFDPLAIARMVRYDDMPDAADLAVTVRDDWQGRGVASALLDVLVRHRPPGVTHVLTEVAVDNPASLAMLRRLGHTQVEQSGPSSYDVEVDLDDIGPHERTDPTSEPAARAERREHLQTRDLLCSWLQPPDKS